MADGTGIPELGGWAGPTILVNGKLSPLIEIKPPAPTGAPGYNAGQNANGSDAEIAGKVTSAAQKYGVDPDFALRVAHTESNLNPNAISPKGAVGVMQISPALAKDYGINQYDVDQNIDTGVKHLSNLAPQFGGSHILMAAAYNAGPEAVKKYGGVPPYPETQAYVAKVTGMPARPANVSDDDWNNAKPVSNVVPAPSVAQNRPQVSDEDWNSAKPISVGTSATQQAAPQQTPGYKKALAIAQQNPNSIGSALTGAINSVNPVVGLASNIPGAQNYINSALNGFLVHALPVLQGAQNAVGTGLSNLVGKKTGITAGEAYQAGRDASQQALTSYATQHPILSGAADIGGQIAGSAAIPELKGAALLARLGYGAAKVGGQSALTGAGGTASEGGNAKQIAINAAINGVLGTALSPLGELGEGASLLTRNAGTKTAARFLTPALATSGIVGGATYAQTKNPGVSTVAGLTAGALAGTPGLARSKAAQAILAKILPNDKLAALTKLGETLGNGNIEAGATHLENAPANSSVIEAALPEQRQEIMQTAGETRPANLGPAKEIIAARQHPQVVKGRLHEAIGEHGEGTLTDDLNAATGVNPAEAEMSWDKNIEQQHIANSDLWKKVETNVPVETPEHQELLKEPVISEAVKDAQRFLGPLGSAPNPNYKPPSEVPKVQDLSDEDLAHLYKEAVTSGKLKGNSFEDLQEYLNSKAEPGNNEPETLPTQAAWIYAKRNLAGQVSRNSLTNAALPNHEVSKVSGYKNFDINRLTKQVNAANEQHFPGLSEANKASHEEFGAEEAKDQGFNIGGMGKKAESPEALAERWKDLNDSQKEGMRHGYMQQVYRDVRANPDSAASKYSSDYHKDFQKILFGENGADKFQQSLYNDKLRSAIDKIKIENGNVEPKDLSHLENLLTSENEQKLQNKIYGKDKAEQIRTAIRQELEYAKQGQEISAFEANPVKEGEALKPIASGAFGAITRAGKGLSGIVEGGALGAASAKHYEMAQHAANLIKQGNMTPGARRYLGELLAKPSNEAAQELRQAVAQKRNMKMSKSTIPATVGHVAATVGANATGKFISNAFSGVDGNAQ